MPLVPKSASLAVALETIAMGPILIQVIVLSQLCMPRADSSPDDPQSIHQEMFTGAREVAVENGVLTVIAGRQSNAHCANDTNIGEAAGNSERTGELFQVFVNAFEPIILIQMVTWKVPIRGISPRRAPYPPTQADSEKEPRQYQPRSFSPQ